MSEATEIERKLMEMCGRKCEWGKDPEDCPKSTEDEALAFYNEHKNDKGFLVTREMPPEDIFIPL